MLYSYREVFLYAEYALTEVLLWFLQVPLKELQSDAEDLFDIVESDYEIKEAMKNIQHCKAHDAIYEAVDKLNSAREQDPKKDIEYVDISIEVHL